jgi:hypothetical protein
LRLKAKNRSRKKHHLNLGDVANHVESGLGQIIVVTCKHTKCQSAHGPESRHAHVRRTGDKTLEGGDVVSKADKLARSASEHLSDVEGLGHELLDLAGARDSDLVVLGELVHAENGNDILEILVILESLLQLNFGIATSRFRKEFEKSVMRIME